MQVLSWLALAAAMLLVCPALAGEPDWRAMRRDMIRWQISGRGISDARVLEAMGWVPRQMFVPPELQAMAYEDHPLPIGHDQTISQPYIVAYMTQALGLSGGETVLEIGTGSGYQAAVLGRIAGRVYSIEIVPELASQAAETLREMGYDNVEVRCGDGWQGWPEAAPFDAIMVTAGGVRIPPKLREQLKPGGRLIMPVGRPSGHQELVLATKQHDGTLKKEYLLPVRFVPLTGGPDAQAPKTRD